MAAAVKHTQGPWKIRWPRDGSGDVGITADDLPNVLAECFADIRSSGERATDEAAANARLIASAPELLALLRELIDIEGPCPGTASWAKKVQAAIARATGEPA